MGSKKVIWKLFVTKNYKVSILDKTSNKVLDDLTQIFQYMNGHTALDWIKMGDLNSIIATEPMQCFIDEIMAGMYLPHKFKLSSNPFRKRNWRLILSYMSFGTLAPILLEE